MAKATGQGGIDYPDFGRSVGEMQNQAEIMLSELAVRLGHTQVFENTGNILYTEDFDNGLANWRVTSILAAELPVLSATYAKFGYYSVKLFSTAPIAKESTIDQYFSYPYLSTFGIEFSFLAVSDFEKLRFSVHYCDDEHTYYAIVEIRNNDNSLYFFNDSGVYEKLADFNLRVTSVPHWRTAKLVIDTNTLCYSRFMIDHKNYDMSNKGFYLSGDARRNNMAVFIKLIPEETTSEAVWVDNIIITRNEPT